MKLFERERDTPLFRTALDLCRRFRSAGGQTLFVGGCVRDSLLQQEAKDLDMEVRGLSPEQVQRCTEEVCELDSVGKSFGVFKVRHQEIDIALPRRENKTGAGHKGFMVEPDPALTIPEAAARRDFTVNAMMYDPLTEEFIDPWNGAEDLKKKILRHVSDHFAEDPLRVLRGMQFAARLDFSVAPETVKLCSSMRQEELPPERIAGEWEKLCLKSVRPSRGLNFLRACGWSRYYPELQALSGCPQNPRWHGEGDVWNHTMNALDASVALRYGDPEADLILFLSVLCHDFGKPLVTTVRENGDIISHGHDEAGVEPADRFIRRIWRIKGLPEKVTPCVKAHMRVMTLADAEATDRAYRRLAVAVGNPDLLSRVCECDIRASIVDRPGAREESLEKLEFFRKRLRELDVKNAPPRPILQGRDLLEKGFKPGPEMGKILKLCYEAQLDGRFSDRAGAMDFLNTLMEKNNG